MTKTIAIPCDVLGVLDAHFGHCKVFSMVYVEDNKMVKEEKLVPPPHEPGLLPKWLAEKGATDIIAGGMGQKAIELFNASSVNVVVGAPKLKVKELVEGYLTGTLDFSANSCDH